MSAPGWLFRRRSFASDLVQTTLVNTAVLVCTILTYGVAARIFNDDAVFSAYGTFRRLNVAIRPVIGLSLALALTRYLPLHALRGWAGRWRLLWLTTGIVLAAACVTGALMLLFPGAVSAAILGDAQYEEWIPGLLAIIVGLLLHSQASSYFRGRMHVDIANLTSVLNLGAVPLAALLIVNRPDLSAVLLVSGGGMCLVSGLFLVLAVIESRSAADEPQNIEGLPGVGESARELLAYGLPRVPGFIAMSVMWVISPVLVNQMGGLAMSIYIVMGMQILSITAHPVRPMATVFLPRFAEMKTKGRVDEMNSLVRMMGAMLIQTGVFIAVQLVVFMPLLLEVWLDRGGAEAVLPVSIIALAIPAFMLYETLRNTIESYTEKPLVANVAVLALAVLVSLVFILRICGLSPVLSVAIATSAAFYLCGILIYRIANRLYRSERPVLVQTGNALGIGLALLLGLPAWGLSQLLQPAGIWSVIIGIVVFELASMSLYLFVLYRSGADWLRELLFRLRKKSQKFGSEH